MLAILSAVLVSCKKEVGEIPYSISVYPDELYFSTNGEERSVYVESSHDWKLAECPDWCTPSKTTGQNNDEIVFNAMPNETFKTRKAELLFTCHDKTSSVTINQAGKIGVSSSTDVKISPDEQIFTVEIVTGKPDKEYEYMIYVADGDDWLTIGNRNETEVGETVTVQVDFNETFESRIGTVIVKFDEINEITEIHILQEENTLENLAYTVNVQDKGSLAALLEKQGIWDAKYLIISGELNDLDFLTIQKMRRLKYLDIADVNLKELPNNSFYETTIESIVLPKSLVKIDANAFNNGKCKFVKLSNNIIEIEHGAFYRSTLKSITLPASVEILGDNIFGYCEQLENVEFEDGWKVTTIPDFMFWYSGIKSIELPSCISTIGVNAFSRSSLHSISIPLSVEIIEECAFFNCSELKSVVFEDGSKLKELRYDESERICYTSSMYSGATGVFQGCRQLESISIPPGVKEIGNLTFANCTNLKIVKFEGDTKLQRILGDHSYEDIPNERLHYYSTPFYNVPIELFVLNAKEPPQLYLYSFHEYGPRKMFYSLKVPDECVEAYKGSAWANYFYNISGLNE